MNKNSGVNSETVTEKTTEALRGEKQEKEVEKSKEKFLYFRSFLFHSSIFSKWKKNVCLPVGGLNLDQV